MSSAVTSLRARAPGGDYQSLRLAEDLGETDSSLALSCLLICEMRLTVPTAGGYCEGPLGLQLRGRCTLRKVGSEGSMAATGRTGWSERCGGAGAAQQPPEAGAQLFVNILTEAHGFLVY